MDADNASPGIARCSHALARIPNAWWMVLAALVLALAGFFGGERVAVNGGFGWDGVIYAHWAQNFQEEVFVQGVDSYYVKRILPSAVVHYSMRLLTVPRTDRNVILAFGLLDVGLITLMAWLWGRIARQLYIGDRGQWLGFVGLFVNYIILKHTFYCPVTTDVAGFALGAAMLWCYLDGRRIALGAVIVAGAFTWPMTVHIGALLLIFPRDPVVDREAAPARPIWPLLAASVLTVVTLVAIKFALRHPPNPNYVPFLTPVRAVLNLSIGISLVYLFLGTACLLDHDRLFAIRRLLTRQRLAAGLLVLALNLAIGYVQHRWAVRGSEFGIGALLPQTAYATVAKPGVFLVTHVAYYGPMFLLALFLWRPVCRLLHQHGLGLTLAVWAGLILSLNSQSRFALNVWVLLVPFIVKATERLGWGLRQYGLIAGLALLGSKVWLTINCGPFTGKLLEFPDQYLFMSHGPWISHDMYLVQGAVFVVAAALLYVVCFRQAAAGQSQGTGDTIRLAA